MLEKGYKQLGYGCGRSFHKLVVSVFLSIINIKCFQLIKNLG